MKHILLLILTICLLSSVQAQDIATTLPTALQEDIKTYCNSLMKCRYVQYLEPAKTTTPDTNDSVYCFSGEYKKEKILISFHMDIYPTKDTVIRDIDVTIKESNLWKVEYDSYDDTVILYMSDIIDDLTAYEMIKKTIMNVKDFTFTDDKKKK